MRPDAEAAYQDLIESLADGQPLDWGSLEAQARTEIERRRYRNLRLVARVAELHRTLSPDDPPDPGVPAPTPLTQERLTTWGHLEIVERLASGSFGELYRARDPQLEREVALKLLRPEASARPLTTRLLSEARTLAKVHHTNVVVVHGADVRDGRAGLWMELIDGRTLEAWVGEHGPMGAGEATAIGRDLCHALAAVHAAGLVHSDVKAQNVMRETGGRIVLMDFGAGRAQGSNIPVAGTPMYFAPEVLAGEPPTPRSDVYSLGVLLFYLLTKRYPTPADDITSLRQAHANGTRVHLRDLRPDLPHPLVDGIERALDPDPAGRFATAGAMERALAEGAAVRPRRGLGFRAAVAAAVLGAIAVVSVAVPRLRTPAPVPVRSIGVLPFTPPAGDLSHLVMGLSTDVVRQLQRFDIDVKSAQAPAIGPSTESVESRIGADAILRGVVSMDGKTPRLRVSIVRAGTTEQWWREYSFDPATVPALAAAIVGDVTAMLRVPLRPGALAPHQTNPRAYDAYQRGRVYQEQRSEESLMRSLEYFKLAADLDKQFAEPYAGMADTYMTLGVPPFGSLRPIEARRRAKEAALQALDRNPNLVEAHTSLAWSAALHDWDWDVAERRFKRAFELNDQYPLAYHWYAMYLTDMGRFSEARSALARAQTLEPLSLLIHRDFGWISFCEGRYDEAIAQLRETLSKDSSFGPAITLLARALAEKGQFDEALKELDRAKGLLAPGWYLSFRAYIEAAAGHPAAQQTLAALRQTAGREYVTRYYLALVYTALRQPDRALRELELAYDEQDATLGTVNVDPRFERIRKQPRFQKLIERMHYPDPRP